MLWGIGVWIGFLFLSVLFLGWRRMGGFFSVPLSGWTAFGLGGTLCAGTWWMLNCLRRSGHNPWPVMVLTFLALGLIGVCVQIPGTHAWAMGGYWIWVLVTWCAGLEKCFASDSVKSPQLDEETDFLLAPDVMQQLTRRVSAKTGDTLEGLVRVTFPPRQRQAELYVTFCPPFPCTPQVFCESVDGDVALQTPFLILPHGVRISLSRADSSPLEDTVLLTFRAREKAQEKVQEKTQE